MYASDLNDQEGSQMQRFFTFRPPRTRIERGDTASNHLVRQLELSLI